MVFILSFLFSSFLNFAFAGSLKGTADALGSEASRFGLAVGLISLVIAGTYLHMGKQEGGQKVTQAILGILVILSAQTIITTLRSVSGGGA
jgi:type IV secretory pathway VirB2 component (pilin)